MLHRELVKCRFKNALGSAPSSFRFVCPAESLRVLPSMLPGGYFLPTNRKMRRYTPGANDREHGVGVNGETKAIGIGCP